MTPAVTALMIHGLMAFSLVVGGILAIRYGFELFRMGRRKTQATASLHFGNAFRATANGVGAVTMITAVGWGWLAVRALPTYKSPQEEVAYSFDTPAGTVKAPEISLASSPRNSTTESGLLLDNFKAALSNTNTYEWETPTISGRHAKCDAASATYSLDRTGKHLFGATCASGGESAAVTYRLATKGEKLVLIPESATLVHLASEGTAAADDHTG